MTAVQWLIDNLEKYEDYAKISWRCLGEIEIALEMEKEQIIDAFRKGAGTHYPTDYTWVDSAWRKEAESYYTSTYGSNGSDDHIVDTNEMVDQVPDVRKMVSSQTEISDEEMEKCIGDGMHEFYKGGFIEGAKWYREQLKQRQ